MGVVTALTIIAAFLAVLIALPVCAFIALAAAAAHMAGDFDWHWDDAP